MNKKTIIVIVIIIAIVIIVIWQGDNFNKFISAYGQGYKQNSASRAQVGCTACVNQFQQELKSASTGVINTPTQVSFNRHRYELALNQLINCANANP